IAQLVPCLKSRPELGSGDAFTTPRGPRQMNDTTIPTPVQQEINLLLKTARETADALSRIAESSESEVIAAQIYALSNTLMERAFNCSQAFDSLFDGSRE